MRRLIERHLFLTALVFGGAVTELVFLLRGLVI